MRNACANTSDASPTRLVRRIVAATAAGVAALLTGCAGTSASSPVAQTAAVLGQTWSDSPAVFGSSNAAGSYAVPERIFCPSRAAAEMLANARAGEPGVSMMLTSGTPSMEPVIRGQVYVLVQYLQYDTIAPGDLLVYQGRPNASKSDRSCMLHRAVKLDRGGWLMCGDNNRWSESWDRVTPVTYLGTVTTIIEFPRS
jgi:hypothetical protein